MGSPVNLPWFLISKKEARKRQERLIYAVPYVSRDLWHLQKAPSERGWNPVSGSEPDEQYMYNSTDSVEIKVFWKCWKSTPKWLGFLIIACTDIGKKSEKERKTLLQEQRRTVLRIYKKMLNCLHKCLSSNAEISVWDGFPLFISQCVYQRPREMCPQTTKTWR